MFRCFRTCALHVLSVMKHAERFSVHYQRECWPEGQGQVNLILASGAVKGVKRDAEPSARSGLSSAFPTAFFSWYSVPIDNFRPDIKCESPYWAKALERILLWSYGCLVA